MAKSETNKKRRRSQTEQAKRDKKKKRNKQLLKEVRERAQAEVMLGGVAAVTPEEAVTHVLDRSFGMLSYAESEVDKLNPDEFWRPTMNGKIPNEWVRFEQSMRQEVFYMASRAVALGIAERSQKLAEKQADLLFRFIESTMEDLGLTDEQRRRLAPAMRNNIAMIADLEGTAREVTPAVEPPKELVA